MKILIIEDELDIQVFLKRNLEVECFEVDVATDGLRGLLLAKTNIYDLIILDNMLPKKSGKEICQELRALGRVFPILMLSVKSDTTTKVSLLNAGADDYLAKPFSFEELLARIYALLRRPRLIVGNRVTAGDITLDAVSHRVTRAGHTVTLTRKELMLLEYFMRSSGVVLSRAMIMEHVWDINADPFSNTIEAHILSLRKKLGASVGQKCIHTIPGRGYKFDNGVSQAKNIKIL